MDSTTNTERIDMKIDYNSKTNQEHLLLEMIKEICSEDKLTSKLRGKVSRIIADCDLTHHSSLHKISSTDEGTSTLLGLLNQTSTELSHGEQAELNRAVIKSIQKKIPSLTKELETLTQKMGGKKSRKVQMKELQESLEDKLNTLQEQGNEKVELMMEWFNHRLSQVTTISDGFNEALALKTRILEVKSQILHLQILQNIFTETNKSIEAYSEIHKDLKDSIKETEKRLKYYKEVIDTDFI